MIRPPFAALAYGALLAAMALGQLADPAAFAAILATYRVPGRAEPVLAAFVPAAELAVAAGLLGARVVPRPLASAAALGGLVVAVFWSTLAAQAFARGLSVPNCGCFGIYLAQELRWWVLLQDAYMLVLAAFAARAARRSTRVAPLRATTET